jgi:hypothetical protein
LDTGKIYIAEANKTLHLTGKIGWLMEMLLARQVSSSFKAHKYLMLRGAQHGV